jgi:hypothetical protein
MARIVPNRSAFRKRNQIEAATIFARPDFVNVRRRSKQRAAEIKTERERKEEGRPRSDVQLLRLSLLKDNRFHS